MDSFSKYLQCFVLRDFFSVRISFLRSRTICKLLKIKGLTLRVKTLRVFMDSFSKYLQCFVLRDFFSVRISFLRSRTICNLLKIKTSYKNFPRKVVRCSFHHQNFEIICHPDVNRRNSNKNKVQAQNPWTTIRYT